MLIIPPPRPNDDRSSRKPNNAKGALSLFIVIPFLVPLASWAGHSQTANPTIPQVAAATSAMHTEDGISPIAEPPARPADKSPVAEPPEKSSDKGFSTEDFLQPDKKDERNRNRDAQLVPRSTEPPRTNQCARAHQRSPLFRCCRHVRRLSVSDAVPDSEAPPRLQRKERSGRC